jgi:hypothetical protein
MDIISRTRILDLIQSCKGFAVTIYLPTFVTGRRKEQSPIRLKNLYNQVEKLFSETGIRPPEIKSFLKPIENLINDEIFWQQQTEGLALFLDKNNLHLYQLPEPVEESLFIGNHFHITPLIPIYHGNGQYYLLRIDQERPNLMKGSKFQLEEVDELDLPESLQKIFDDYFEFHSHLSFHTSTSTPNPDLPSLRHGEFFGQSGGDDIDEKAEIRNFFHRFDDALMEYIVGQDIPLVLAGVGYLHNLYRQANTYPNLVDEGITKNIDQMSTEELHRLSWQIVENNYKKDIEKALDNYHQIEAKKGDISAEIDNILPAAYYQRVHTLFAAEDVCIWGTFTPEENKINIEGERSFNNEELINLAVSYTLINGGQVFLIPKDKVPSDSSMAAILHY